MEYTTIITIIWIFWILFFLIFDKFFNQKWWNIEKKFEEKLELEINKIEEKNQENLNELKNKISELEWERRILSEENIRIKIELDKKNEILWEKESELKKEIEDKNIAQWKVNQMFAEFAPLKEKYSNILEKNDELNTKIWKLESELEYEKNKKNKDFEKKIKDLENSRISLEDEKMRIRKEDEKDKQEKIENRNRIWKEHENIAISKMTEICQKRNFNFYRNENLPVWFTWKFKPDFMVEFLWKYIIFDAKTSISADLNTYIKAQFKSTAKKIKDSENSEDFSKSVYLVVPSIWIKDLKQENLYSKEQWFDFYVISIESFEAILACFEIIKWYKNLENIDPRERENIIEILWAYENHITFRNSLDILSTLRWIELWSLKNKLSNDMIWKINKHIKLNNFTQTDIKKYLNKPDKQLNEIKKMIEPKKAEVILDEIE